MKIAVEINCETGSEALNHFTQIVKELKAQLKKQAATNIRYKIVEFKDNNCYGRHHVKITNFTREEITA